MTLSAVDDVARAVRAYWVLDGISLGNGWRGELFEDFAHLVLHFLVVLERLPIPVRHPRCGRRGGTRLLKR